MSTKTTMRVVAATSALVMAGVSAMALGPNVRGAQAEGEVVLAAHDTGKLIVTYSAGADSADKEEARVKAKAEKATPASRSAQYTEVYQLQAGQTAEQAMAALATDPDVVYSEPDYLLTTFATANDPNFTNGNLWGLYSANGAPTNPNGSRAADAWSMNYTGSKSVVVAVLDEGVDLAHQDLAANAWVNTKDAVDGIDNDGNGYIDDTNGWDFFNRDRTVFDGAADDHGTHVAGTIGAVGGNGIGVTGVNWNVSLMSAKFMGASGGYVSDAIKAIDYVTDQKVRNGVNVVAINASWGGQGYSQSLLDAINRAGDAGIFFVAAAGNSSSNNDATPYYPASYECTTRSRDVDCVIAVAAMDSAANLPTFSNYGVTSVDLAAPGQDIVSTLPGNTYGAYSGTSMAAPHVTGAIALCESINPSMSMQQVRDALLSTLIPSIGLVNRVATGGRLDAGALAMRCGPTKVFTTTLPDAQVTVPYSQQLTAVGSVGPYTWTLSAGSLPAGLSLSADGVLSGTPPTGATSSFTVRATSSTGSAATQALSLIVRNPVRVTTTSLLGGAQGTAYKDTLAATGGTPAYTWAMAGGYLPGGLTLTSSTGVIAGTPTTGGTFDFTVRVTAADKTTATAPMSITLSGLAIDNKTLPSGAQYATYSAQLVGSGGSGSYSFARSSGSLPSGVTLSSTGLISGSPTVSGTFTITVKMKDNVTSKYAYRTLQIVLAPAPPKAFSKSLPANAATGIATSYKFTWVAATGATSYEFCVDMTPNDTCDGAWTTGITRSYYSKSGLTAKTTYYWTVRAKNTIGTTMSNSGTWWSFTTA